MLLKVSGNDRRRKYVDREVTTARDADVGGNIFRGCSGVGRGEIRRCRDVL